MTTPRIGIDIVPLERATGLIAAGRTLTRMLQPTELLDSRRTHGLDAAAVAGRLAVKEAVFKLFHRSGEVLPWLDIKIRTGTGGWPTVELTGRAERMAATAAISGIAISIAHDGDYAIAVATAYT
jgi:holo-[acyl-carrier protein] synthase